MVFLLDVKNVSQSQKILDTLLGFAAGVMLAASYWSLLVCCAFLKMSLKKYI